jgi:hypothetical protein
MGVGLKLQIPLWQKIIAIGHCLNKHKSKL